MYANRGLKGAERRYIVTEFEGLALVWALKKWRVILMGRKVRVRTDHRALKFISACAVANQRMARWQAFLQEFDLDIQHIPGSTNTSADTLSQKQFRRRKHKSRASNNAQSLSSSDEVNDQEFEWTNDGRKKYASRIGMMAEPDEEQENRDWVEIIRRAQVNNPTVTDLPNCDPNKYSICDNIIRITDKDKHERVVLSDEIA